MSLNVTLFRDILYEAISGKAVRMGGFFHARKGAAMVDRSTMLRSALRAYRKWGTVMSRAMLRALGCDLGAVAAGVESDAYEPDVDGETAWCFANHGSPMDGRF